MNMPISDMNKRAVLLGALAYTLVTFPLAVVWHVTLFKSTYESLGYFTGEPNFLLGLVTIVLQGLILSALFPLFKLTGNATQKGFKYALLIGIFFWTSHVLAYAAKNPMSNSASYFSLETVYLALQFGIYGFFIGKIYKTNADIRVTCINCIDGRTQLPVYHWIQSNYQIDFVDMVTAPGADGALASGDNIDAIIRSVGISVDTNKSEQIFIAGHHDCKGNPVDEKTHQDHVIQSVGRLKEYWPQLKIIGLWINNNWKVEKIDHD